MIIDSDTHAAATHSGSLRQSVCLLAQLAAQAAGAAGYSLLDYDSGTPHCSDGSTTAPELSQAQFPICVQGNQVGTLVFTFLENPIPEEKLSLLNQMAAAIESVQALPHVTAHLAERVASLDAELADIKIGERTRGLLAGDAAGEDAVKAIIRHVEHVLEGRPLGVMYDDLLATLEERVEERKMLAVAKAALQDRCGMSEEEAYLHMRVRSRSSRKRLREVARELISEPAGIPQTKQMRYRG